MAFVGGAGKVFTGTRQGLFNSVRCEQRRESSSSVGARRSVVCAALEVEKHVPTGEAPAQFIEVTPVAVKQLNTLKESNGKDCLRVGVRQGGCSGMSYFMEFEDEANIEKFDEVVEVEGMRIVCDMKSLMYMFGMTLDFSTDLVGGGFKFFNPKATSTCGCGQSFGV